MYKLKILSLFLLILMFFYNVKAYITEAPFVGKLIYLDAGHGGVDPGAFYKDVYEENINLKITLKLKDKLEQMGAIVYITRDGDYDLSNPKAILRKRSDLLNRAQVINKSNADIYLSIHLNASTSTSWKGAQAFYDDINEENKKIAETFQECFNKNLNSKRSAKEIKNLYMYQRIKIKGVLLELGFLSNPNERYILNQEWYQNKSVNVMSKCLIDILT